MPDPTWLLKAIYNAAMQVRCIAMVPFALVVLFALQSTSAQTQPVQSSDTAALRFAVLSIKPCGANSEASAGNGGAQRASVPAKASPGEVVLGCLPLGRMVRIAVGNVASAHFDSPWNFGSHPIEIEGGPAWVESDRYRLEAKPESALPRSTMYGPMLQAALEERFNLKTHRETRQVPIFALAVAESGLKLQRVGDHSCTEPYAGGPSGGGLLPLGCSKLRRAEEGACFPFVAGQPPVPGKPECGVRSTYSATRQIIDILGSPLAMIASFISGDATGRPVVDETGISDKFDAHLEFSPENAPPSADPDGVPTVFGVLGQLGLKLKPGKGPRDFLVIDHVERPSAN